MLDLDQEQDEQTTRGESPTRTGETDDRETGESGSEGDEGGEYLVVVDYGSEAERKRVEYLLNNRDDIDVEQIQGFARIVRTDDFESLYEDLSSKVDKMERLQVDRLEEVETEPAELHEEFDMVTEIDRERIEWAFDTLKDKRGATVEDPGNNQYIASTRKGTARYSYSVRELDEGQYEVHVEIWGYGDAPRVMKDFLEDELEHFL